MEHSMPGVTAPASSSLSAALLAAASGPTPDEPEFLGSWINNVPDCQFEVVAVLVGDNGVTPALAHLNDSERRAILCRVANHLGKLQ